MLPTSTASGARKSADLVSAPSGDALRKTGDVEHVPDFAASDEARSSGRLLAPLPADPLRYLRVARFYSLIPTRSQPIKTLFAFRRLPHAATNAYCVPIGAPLGGRQLNGRRQTNHRLCRPPSRTPAYPQALRR